MGREVGGGGRAGGGTPLGHRGAAHPHTASTAPPSSASSALYGATAPAAAESIERELLRGMPSPGPSGSTTAVRCASVASSAPPPPAVVLGGARMPCNASPCAAAAAPARSGAAATASGRGKLARSAVGRARRRRRRVARPRARERGATFPRRCAPAEAGGGRRRRGRRGHTVGACAAVGRGRRTPPRRRRRQRRRRRAGSPYGRLACAASSRWAARPRRRSPPVAAPSNSRARLPGGVARTPPPASPRAPPRRRRRAARRRATGWRRGCRGGARARPSGAGCSCCWRRSRLRLGLALLPFRVTAYRTRGAPPELLPIPAPPRRTARRAAGAPSTARRASRSPRSGSGRRRASASLLYSRKEFISRRSPWSGAWLLGGNCGEDSAPSVVAGVSASRNGFASSDGPAAARRRARAQRVGRAGVLLLELVPRVLLGLAGGAARHRGLGCAQTTQ